MPALPEPRLAVAKPVLLPVGRDYLRNEIRDRHATVASLAKALGVSRKQLSNVLNGHAPSLGPSCQALMIEPSFLGCLLDYGPEPEPAGYGAMAGTIEVLVDPTEPMQASEMLEE